MEYLTTKTQLSLEYIIHSQKVQAKILARLIIDSAINIACFLIVAAIIIEQKMLPVKWNSPRLFSR